MRLFINLELININIFVCLSLLLFLLFSTLFSSILWAWERQQSGGRGKGGEVEFDSVTS